MPAATTPGPAMRQMVSGGSSRSRTRSGGGDTRDEVGSRMPNRISSSAPQAPARWLRTRQPSHAVAPVTGAPMMVYDGVASTPAAQHVDREPVNQAFHLRSWRSVANVLLVLPAAEWNGTEVPDPPPGRARLPELRRSSARGSADTRPGMIGHYENANVTNKSGSDWCS
jgi:hypothetical protein